MKAFHAFFLLFVFETRADKAFFTELLIILAIPVFAFTCTCDLLTCGLLAHGLGIACTVLGACLVYVFVKLNGYKHNKIIYTNKIMSLLIIFM